MKNKLNKIVVIVIVVFVCFGCQKNMSSLSNSKNQNKLAMPNEPGKCFAKALLPEKHSIDTVAILPIYNGDTPESFGMQEFVIHEGRTFTKWVKKKANRNCLSKNPDDCLVWCLEEVKEERETIDYLIDTTQTKDFTMKIISKTTVVSKGGEKDWIEVVCEKDLGSNFYRKLSLALMGRGYLKAEDQLKMDLDVFSKPLKNSLTRFQQDQGYPIGALGINCLTDLGVLEF